MSTTAVTPTSASPTAARTGIFLGFDFGTQRIGIAAGQGITRTASPVVTLNTCNGKPDWRAISLLIETWQPEGLIVGIPRRHDGSDNPVTAAAQRFARQLAGRYRLAVHAVDELLSSVEAAHIEVAQWHGKSAPVDARAAQIILQTWLLDQGRDDHG